MTKNICVFCSSSDDIKQAYYREAHILGDLIASNDCNLIYGGTDLGLMKAVADSVRENGGQVVGIIPRKFVQKGIATKDADNLLVTADMKERKAMMRERADAFVALPGGFGTLEEVLEVITLKLLGYHNLPIVFVDVDEFYLPLIQQFEIFYQQNFAKSDYFKMYQVVSSSREAWEYIQSYSCK